MCVCASDVNTSTTVQVAVKGRRRREPMVFYCRRRRHRCCCCCCCCSSNHVARPNAAVVNSASASAKLVVRRSKLEPTHVRRQRQALCCAVPYPAVPCRAVLQPAGRQKCSKEQEAPVQQWTSACGAVGGARERERERGVCTLLHNS